MFNLYFWHNFGASPRRFPKFICYFAPFSIEFDPIWTPSQSHELNISGSASACWRWKKENKKLKSSKRSKTKWWFLSGVIGESEWNGLRSDQQRLKASNNNEGVDVGSIWVSENREIERHPSINRLHCPTGSSRRSCEFNTDHWQRLTRRWFDRRLCNFHFCHRECVRVIKERNKERTKFG